MIQLEKPEAANRNRQSRNTGNTEYKTHRVKTSKTHKKNQNTKNNSDLTNSIRNATHIVRRKHTQKDITHHTRNWGWRDVVGREEPNIVCMWKS